MTQDENDLKVIESMLRIIKKAQNQRLKKMISEDIHTANYSANSSGLIDNDRELIKVRIMTETSLPAEKVEHYFGLMINSHLISLTTSTSADNRPVQYYKITDKGENYLDLER
jgi:predicted transcriptional regulator